MLFHKVFLNPSSSEWTVFIHGFGGSSNVWFKQLKNYRENFNVVLIDLRGHGKSQNLPLQRQYSFELIAQEVAEVILYLKIKKAHFIGVSLGTIVIRQLAVNYPKMIKSMIFAGAITQLDIKSRFFLRLGRTFQPFLPYMALYRLFANIMMPKKNHRESRSIFINEARKLMQREFLRWFKLTGKLTKYLKYLHHENRQERVLYIMGSEDHLFLGPAKELVKNGRNLELEIVENCGHVVNVERPGEFNRLSIEFIKRQSGFEVVPVV